MQTRRDQLHAYQFMTRRAMSALMTGEPDTVEPPMRRLTLLTISGVMIAIIVAVVFLVLGLFQPGGGSDWDESGTVIIERETGAIFVVDGDKLQPALNFASAVLAAQGGQSQGQGQSGAVDVQLVQRKKLASKDRVGEMIGDPSLPNSVPSEKDLVTGPITLCSTPQTDGSGTNRTSVRLRVGTSVATDRLGSDEVLLVRTPEDRGSAYALWGGQRIEVSPQRLAQLHAGDDQVVPVGAAFLNAIPAAADNTPFPVDARVASEYAADSPCASYDSKGGVTLSTLRDARALPSDSWPKVDAVSPNKIQQVDLKDGAGVVAQSAKVSKTYFLIANSLAYPANRAEYLSAFGYTDKSEVLLPQELLSVIPRGAALDPSTASRPVALANGSGIG